MTTPTTKITQSDLKFYPSERLDDTHEGGGLALGTPIKGVANELFTPVSSLAYTNGDFATRLMYAGVQRDDNEPLIGPFVAITKPPKDEATSYVLFPAKFGELRAEAIKRIENYNTATIESSMTLLSNPARGSKIIQAYQRIGEKLPVAGEVYCLRQEKLGFTKLEQYIQLVKVEATERTFTTPDGREFNRMVIKMETIQPINHDFIGADYPSDRYADAPTKIRETHVADAANYYGIKPLVQAINTGSSQLQVSSIVDKLVPTTQIETVMADVKIGKTAMLFDSSLAQASLYINAYTNPQTTWQLLPFVPDTLNFDNRITCQNNVLMSNGEAVGKVDPIKGMVSFNRQLGHIGRAYFKPAVIYSTFADSYRIDIDIKNRSYNHAITLPNVGTGSLSVSYLSQGSWYELTDDGAGRLVGASDKHGSGSVNYHTGTVVVTCGSLPDVGSAIIFTSNNAKRLQKVSSMKSYMLCQLESDPSVGSLSIQVAGLQGRLGKDNTIISDYLKGFYDPSTRRLLIEYGTHYGSVTINYNTGTRQSINITAPSRDGEVVLNLSDTAIAKGSLELKYPVVLSQTIDEQEISQGELIMRVYDDGLGNLKDVGGVTIGSIEYETATARFNPKATVGIDLSEPKYRYESYSVRHGGRLFGPKYTTHTRKIFDGYTAKKVQATFATDGIVQASFYDNEQGGAVNQEFSTAQAFMLELHGNEKIVPNSLVLDSSELVYDRHGVLYNRLEVTTGQPAEKIGTIDYNTGLIIFNKDRHVYHTQLVAAAKTSSEIGIDAINARTSVAPVRLSSIQVVATLTNGTTISGTADSNGNIDSEWISGKVDAKHGLISVNFGKQVAADGHQDKPWYDPKSVVEGQIWQPASVIADSVRYNAIGYRHLPINSAHIKIDTVRLPSDGQVPIFRRGDTILISNSQSQVIGSAHSAGQTVQLNRNNLDRICIKDANNKPVIAPLWEYDLDDGTITWNTPLDLSDYTMPLTVVHTLEEKNRVVEVDIDGTLTLMFPVKHSYEPDNTYVSSLLISDDLAVRHSIPFTQTNWDSVWRDTPNGEQLLNRLNVKDYPIVLTDDGAITERWLIKFANNSQFELYGETLGFVLKTDTLQDLAPINPATHKPYFTLPKEAFGGSQGQAPWQAQNIIRFNTTGTLLPFWVLRAVQPTSAKPDTDDGFSLCLFGDTTKI